MNLYYKLAKQKKRASNQKKYHVIEMEVDCLLKAGFIKVSFYPYWVSNVVLDKKSNGKWHTWVDFIDMNKSSPNDSFP